MKLKQIKKNIQSIESKFCSILPVIAWFVIFSVILLSLNNLMLNISQYRKLLNSVLNIWEENFKSVMICCLMNSRWLFIRTQIFSDLIISLRSNEKNLCHCGFWYWRINICVENTFSWYHSFYNHYRTEYSNWRLT